MIRIFIIAMILFSHFSYSQVTNIFSIQHSPYEKALNNDKRQHSNPNRSIIISDDFSSAANWTISSSGQGTWQLVTSLSSAQQSFMGQMQSTTFSNGYATFDASIYLQGQASSQQAAELTFNQLIDLSTYADVIISFEQLYRRHNNDICMVEVSNDAGLTWTSFVVNNDVIPLSAADQNKQSINVSSIVGNSSSAYFRFVWQSSGDAFGWVIDDFLIETAPTNDLILMDSYHYDKSLFDFTNIEIPYLIVPYSQIGPINFNSKAYNLGASIETNCNLEVSVNYNSSQIYSTNSALQTMSSGQTISNLSANWLSPNAGQGQYNIQYNLNYDNLIFDNSILNNVLMDSIIVSNNLWARDDGKVNDVSIESGNTTSGCIIGNIFHCQSTADLKEYLVAFSPTTDPGIMTCANLYEIDSLGNMYDVLTTCGTIFEFSVAPNQITYGNSVVWAKYNICYQLQANTTYLAAILYYGGTQNMDIMASTSLTDTLSSLIYDGQSATWYYLNNTPMIRMKLGNCNYSQCVADYTWMVDTTQNAVIATNNSTSGPNMTYLWDFGDGTTDTAQFPTHYYSNHGSYYVCLTIEDGQGCSDDFCDTITYTQYTANANDRSGFTLNVFGNPTSTNDELEWNSFEIYPNPITDRITISLRAKENETLNFLISDMTGRALHKQSANIVSGINTVSLPATQLSSGIYIVSCVNSDGKVLQTKRIIK